MKLEKLVGERYKEQPADCVITSHALMVRGGYIKQVGNGLYSSFTPTRRILRKIETLIRTEMDELGGQEVQFPVVMPASLWEESGRYQNVGPELLRFMDRGSSKMVLGMTHEEAAVHLVREYGQTYQKYPFMIYQIQTKFRDEARPRAGLIRVREFAMKDAYSFHTSQEDLEVFYTRCHIAYGRIFKKAGLQKCISVQSDSGMMGGSIADEFILLSDAGEDSVAVCRSCDYRANIEAVEGIAALKEGEQLPEDGITCPKCGFDSINIKRGIEIGNIFQLGTKYSQSMGMRYTDPKGDLKYPIMGCYGIGIGRLAASVIEERHDENGPIWPMSIAPWQVHICSLRADDELVRPQADKLYEELKSRGVEVIYDDRKVSPGAMFADADLLGVPLRIIISPRNVKEGIVEMVSRDKSVQEKIKIEDALQIIIDMIESPILL